jgi:hypothetical protein
MSYKGARIEIQSSPDLMAWTVWKKINGSDSPQYFGVCMEQRSMFFRLRDASNDPYVFPTRRIIVPSIQTPLPSALTVVSKAQIIPAPQTSMVSKLKLFFRYRPGMAAGNQTKGAQQLIERTNE